MAVKRGPRRHRFNEDVEAGDYLGRKWCLDCPLPEDNEAHDIPEVSDEQRQHEARRLGEDP